MIASLPRQVVGSLSVRRMFRAFTLVEMLVVITIMTLLLALLLPSMSGAKEYSKQVICASTLHSLGEGYHSYAADSKSILPPYAYLGNPSICFAAAGTGYDTNHPSAPGFGAGQGIYLYAFGYVPNPRGFECPSTMKSVSSVATWTALANWYVTGCPGFNGNAFPNAMTNAHMGYYTMNGTLPLTAGYDATHFPRTIDDSSSKTLMIDSNQYDETIPNQYKWVNINHQTGGYGGLNVLYVDGRVKSYVLSNASDTASFNIAWGGGINNYCATYWKTP